MTSVSLEEYKQLPGFDKRSAAEVNSMLHVDRLSLSCGEVKSCSKYYIAANVNTVDASGAPFFTDSSIPAFCGIGNYQSNIYLTSIVNGRNKATDTHIDNHILSVIHPHFVQAYINVVLPEIVSSCAIPDALKDYLKDHATMIPGQYRTLVQ
jgi:hypothetical protein